jgi:hypothetical protein
MSGNQQSETSRHAAVEPRTPRPAQAEGPEPAAAPPVASLARKAVAAPRTLRPADVLHLQRTVGNRAVGALLSAVRRNTGRTIQAKPAYFKPKKSSDVTQLIKPLDTLALALDAQTEAAHAYVVGKMKDAADPNSMYELDNGDFPHSSDRRFAFWCRRCRARTPR